MEAFAAAQIFFPPTRCHQDQRTALASFHNYFHTCGSGIQVFSKLCACDTMCSAISDSQAMSDEHTVLPATVKREQRSQITSMSPHRLDTARARIDGVCTEHNHFNPSCFVTESNTSTIACAEAEYDQRFRSPNAHQLRTDLQVLFERFLTLESDAADNAYQRISLRAWEVANDEYGAFDWENLKEIIEDEVEKLKEHGGQVDVSDLVTLRSTTACL